MWEQSINDYVFYYMQEIQTQYLNIRARPDLEVVFEVDRISLELPGSDLPNGWKITPLGPSVVRLCHFTAPEVYDLFV